MPEQVSAADRARASAPPLRWRQDGKMHVLAHPDLAAMIDEAPNEGAGCGVWIEVGGSLHILERAASVDAGKAMVEALRPFLPTLLTVVRPHEVARHG